MLEAFEIEMEEGTAKADPIIAVESDGVKEDDAKVSLIPAKEFITLRTVFADGLVDIFLSAPKWSFVIKFATILIHCGSCISFINYKTALPKCCNHFDNLEGVYIFCFSAALALALCNGLSLSLFGETLWHYNLSLLYDMYNLILLVLVMISGNTALYSAILSLLGGLFGLGMSTAVVGLLGYYTIR